MPGELTSAFLALQDFTHQNFDYSVVPFDEIIDEVVKGKADAGLLIHEGQLFYKRAWDWTKCSTSANGGTRRPACRCRWAATPSAAILARS